MRPWIKKWQLGPVGTRQVLNRSWFSPGPVSVLTQIIIKPASLHPRSGLEHSSIMLGTCLNHAQNIPGSMPKLKHKHLCKWYFAEILSPPPSPGEVEE